MSYRQSVLKLLAICKRQSIRVVPENENACPFAGVAYDSLTNSLYINKNAGASDIAAALKHLEKPPVN